MAKKPAKKSQKRVRKPTQRKSLTVHMGEQLHNKFMQLSLAEKKTRSAILLEMIESYCEELPCGK